MWHLEPGIQPWLSLTADGLYLDRYVSRDCYGVGVYYKTGGSGMNQGTQIRSKCLDLQGRQIKLVPGLTWY